MKKYFIIFLLLFSSRLFAHSYIPFPDSSAWWTVDVHHASFPANQGQYFISGDTIINTLSYHKVFLIDTTQMTVSYQLAMRQDTIAEQVYMKGVNFPEFLAYDFSLAVGDTFYADSFATEFFTVSVVDSILIQGQYRKHLHLIPTQFGCICLCEPDWIEGIGSLYGLLPVQCSEFAVVSLVCFSHFNQQIYPDTGNCYSLLTTGIEDKIRYESITISPNPFSSNISISITKPFSKQILLSIKNLMGQIVFQESENNNSETFNHTISADFLPRGIYFLEAIIGGNRYIKKIVKD